MKTLCIRADANATMGVGHVMRCLALAQGWLTTGGEVVFLSCGLSNSLKKLLLDSGMSCLDMDAIWPDKNDLRQTVEVASQFEDVWLVVDGYQFDADYLSFLHNADLQVLALDDGLYTDRFWDVDLLLNQNLNAELLTYQCASHTECLLGAQYTLLRSEFREFTKQDGSVSEDGAHVLITLGGGDPDNQTLKVVQACGFIRESLCIKVVVGATNPHIQSLQKICDKVRHDIEILQDVHNMPELMDWADIAISAGGSTCWELAFMGVPNLIVVTADNQLKIAKALHQKGVSVNLGWFEDVTPHDVFLALKDLLQNVSKRTEMTQKGFDTIDGLGVERVIKAMRVGCL